MANQSFTSSNMQKSLTLARLDRFLVLTEWNLDYPLTKVEALPRVTSDHCPILLTAKRSDTLKKKDKIFRFKEVWLNHGDFVSKIPDLWKEGAQKKSVVLTFAKKLRHCRTRIKKWCANEIYSIRGLKSRLMGEIQKIDNLEEQ